MKILKFAFSFHSLHLHSFHDLSPPVWRVTGNSIITHSLARASPIKKHDFHSHTFPKSSTLVIRTGEAGRQSWRLFKLLIWLKTQFFHPINSRHPAAALLHFRFVPSRGFQWFWHVCKCKRRSNRGGAVRAGKIVETVQLKIQTEHALVGLPITATRI